jgi:hypothetical protein
MGVNNSLHVFDMRIPLLINCRCSLFEHFLLYLGQVIL